VPDPVFPGESISGGKLIEEGNAEREGVVIGDDGSIRLLKTGENLHYMWLANTDGGYVSKYDTNTGREVARYLTILPARCKRDPYTGRHCALEDNELLRADGPLGPFWDRDGKAVNAMGRLRGLQPSRTAIDYRGDAWVGNRAVLLNPRPLKEWEEPKPEPGTKYASVTKIAHAKNEAEAMERCRERFDKNGNRIVRTSWDKNGNGVIDPNEWFHPNNPELNEPWNWENLAHYDDCVLFTTPVCRDIGTPKVADLPRENAGVRALAVARGHADSGDAWVGCWTDKMFWHLHGDTGLRVGMPIQLDIRPYGAIADNEDRVWAVQKEDEVIYRRDDGTPFHKASERGVALRAVDARGTPPAAGQPDQRLSEVLRPTDGDPLNWCSAYGIALDGQGRIWMAGRFTEGVAICRYDPTQKDPKKAWWHWGVTLQPEDTATNIPGVSFGLARGIAVDPEGWVYISGNGDTTELLEALDWRTTRSQFMVINSQDIGVAGKDPIIDIEVNGKRFKTYDAGNNEKGAIGVGIDTNKNVWMVNHTGTAIQFKPDHAGRVVRLGINTSDILKAAGKTPQSGLYTYSDFTGHQLRTYVPPGYIKFYINACEEDQTPVWSGMVWEGSTPPGSSIRLEVRYSDTEADAKNNKGSSRYKELPALLHYPDTAPGTDGERSIVLGHKGGHWMGLTFYLSSENGQAMPVLRDFSIYVQCQSELR